MAGQKNQVIDIQIGIPRSDVRLELPACEDSLPVVRQALRSIGEAVQADLEALEDAELAVTEAIANAVEHAYTEEDGPVHVSFSPRDEEMLVSVRDFGRGMDASRSRDGQTPGYGLSMIDGIARRLDIRGEGGTEVEMVFGLGGSGGAVIDGSSPASEPAERILRRVVAVVAAQVDMSVERVMEALLVVELVARHGLRHLVGDRVEIRVTRGERSFELRLGPLEEGGACRVVRDSEVPVVGSVVQRLADDVRIEKERVEAIDCEYLLLRLASAPG